MCASSANAQRRRATCSCSRRRDADRARPARDRAGWRGRASSACAGCRRPCRSADGARASSAELEMNDVLVEAGPRLAGALFAAGSSTSGRLHRADAARPEARGHGAAAALTERSRTRLRSTLRDIAARRRRICRLRAPACARQPSHVHRHRPGRSAASSQRSRRARRRRRRASRSDCRSHRRAGRRRRSATASAWSGVLPHRRRGSPPTSSRPTCRAKRCASPRSGDWRAGAARESGARAARRRPRSAATGCRATSTASPTSSRLDDRCALAARASSRRRGARALHRAQGFGVHRRREPHRQRRRRSDGFGVNLIPHTLEVTTLGALRGGHASQSRNRSARALPGAMTRVAGDTHEADLAMQRTP